MHTIEIVSMLMLMAVASSFAWVKDMENPGLYQGDMVLSPDQLEEVRNGTFKFGSINNQEKLWPKKDGKVTIAYYIEKTLGKSKEAIAEIKAALAEYEKYTCIRFKRWYGEQSYISFYNENRGCSSPVGRNCKKGRCYYANRISLSSGCWWRVTIMHEIGHSLGLHHEQSRPDRDSYIKLLKDNINPSMMFNFEKAKAAEIDSLGTPYDYLSMMHYSWNAFGKDQKMTMKTADPKYQYEIGQDVGFSRIDVEQINKLYKCSGTYPTPPPHVFPPKGCFDLGGLCAKSKFYGDCEKPEWQNYVTKHCRKSCGFCDDGPPVTGKPVTYKPSKTDVKPNAKTTAPPKPTASSNCRDRVVDCFTNRGRCNNSRWKRFMHRSCRKTCKLC